MPLPPLKDLTPNGDPKGGSPKTPPGGISLRKYREMTAEEAVSLKDYFEMRLKNIEDASALARTELNGRLETLNDLRQQVVTDRGQFVTRDLHDLLEKEITKVATSVIGIQASNATWAKIIGILLILCQIVSPLILYFVLHK